MQGWAARRASLDGQHLQAELGTPFTARSHAPHAKNVGHAVNHGRTEPPLGHALLIPAHTPPQ